MEQRLFFFSFLFPHTHSKRTLLLTPACPGPSSYVASWHSTARTCVVLVVVATAMAALLLFFVAEVVSFILALVRLVSYDTHVALCHVRGDNSSDFETDGVSEVLQSLYTLVRNLTHVPCCRAYISKYFISSY